MKDSAQSRFTTSSAGTREPSAESIQEYESEKLLGPFNEVERRNAPERLYARGDVSLLRYGARVSIVGARKASPAGLRRARKLAVELAREGVTVVSGLASGIDAAAHTGAMDAKGRTIAVLGTPLDRAYPAENRALQEKIMREHLAVSQFPVGYPIQKQNFPRRNRVMALISDATVIVEASNSSGSISQGWEALRLGRLLLIMRSVVENKELTWPDQMIAYGAQILTETAPLLAMLPVDDVALAAVAF